MNTVLVIVINNCIYSSIVNLCHSISTHGKSCHGGARQASNTLTGNTHNLSGTLYTWLYKHKVNHNVVVLGSKTNEIHQPLVHDHVLCVPSVYRCHALGQMCSAVRQ